MGLVYQVVTAEHSHDAAEDEEVDHLRFGLGQKHPADRALLSRAHLSWACETIWEHQWQAIGHTKFGVMYSLSCKSIRPFHGRRNHFRLRRAIMEARQLRM